MSLKVLTKSSTLALVDLTTVKDRLGISGSAEDTRLTDLITEASSAIVAYLGRDLARQQYREYLDGNGRARLLLTRFPVDPESVTLTIDGTAATDFSVEDPAVGVLWRQGLWTFGDNSLRTWERPEENVVVTYKAGYVLPDQISTWTTAHVYAAGAWVRPTTPTLSPLLFECTTAGTSHATTQPTWPTVGNTVTDNGTLVWTARTAEELPSLIKSCAYLTVRSLYDAMTRGMDVRAIESDGQRIEYQVDKEISGGIPAGVCRTLDSLRFAA